MQIYFDLSFFRHLLDLSVPQIMWQLFINGGWVFFVFLILSFTWSLWIKYRQEKYAAAVNFVLLAIDVPRDNEQSPKAVEHFMTNLAGAHSPFSKWEEWWEGAHQQCFSLEIVSIDGYIQFLIRTPDYARDMVEAGIYAQYPEAEITEVNDYVDSIPDHYPDDNYNFWASELVPVTDEAFPLRTYIDFEHSLTQELKDPLAALLEMFSRVGRGEQMWFQIIVKPTDDKWKVKAQRVVNKLIGAKEPSPSPGIFGGIFKFFGEFFMDFLHAIFGTGPSSPGDKKDDLPSRMLYLSPGQRHTVDAVERKMSKLGFYCKIRVAYVAHKEAYQKAKRVGTFFAAIKQYNTLNANALKPSKEATTKAQYFFAKHRVIAKQNRFMAAYKARSSWRGMPEFILNIEELATLYHFPAYTIKAPLLKRTESKKAEPPASLPFDQEGKSESALQYMSKPEAKAEKESAAKPAKKIDYLPEELQQYDFANDYFEKKFAKQVAEDQASAQPQESPAKQKPDDEVTPTPPGNLPFVD